MNTKAHFLIFNLVLLILSGCGAEDSSDDSSSTATGSSGSGSTTPADALNYPQVSYSFSCPAPVGGSKSVNVSNGPCISQQKNYAKNTSCNLVDSDYTFNSVGKAFYQCLVNNSSGDFKAYYRQYLNYYSSIALPSVDLNSLSSAQYKSLQPNAQLDETFSAAGSVDAWIASSFSSAGERINLSHSDGALNIMLPSTNNQNNFLIETLLANAIDVNGATIAADIYLPEWYLQNGKFVQLYFEDDMGNSATSTISNTGLNLWRAYGSEQSELGIDRFGWVTLSYYVTQSGVNTQSNKDTLSPWSQPFKLNLSKITAVGFVFGGQGNLDSNSKHIIKLDNIVIP